MNIKNIISTYILRKPDYEEKEAIQNWKQDSLDNVESLRRIMKINELTEQVKDYKQVNTSAAWNKVEHHLERQTPVYHITSLKNIAAVAIFLVISLVGYKMLWGPSTPETSLQTFVASTKEDINLADGSFIKLDKTTTLKETGFRSVQLDGRAYFDIATDKSNPFTIRLKHGLITVLGTSFNINTSEKFSQIYVTEGKVKYQFKNEEYILTAGDLLQVSDGNVVRSANPKISPEKWIQQKTVFENNSLHEVLETLAVVHKTDIIFTDQSVHDQCKINTSFTNENIEQILRELEILTGLKYTITNNKILIKAYKC